MSVVAVADGDSTTDTVPRVIPYQGVLEIDGGGYNGEVPMTFAIYLAQTGGSAVWTESQTVSVYNGVFGVTLGATAPIAATIFAADTLWLGITVDGVELSNRQAIAPVPYALWSARSSDFTVARDLTVARDARVDRNLSVAGASSLAGLTVSGSLALPSGSVTGTMLADGTVATADLANDAVTAAKIPAGAVGSSEIADSSITSADIADGSVFSVDIADSTVTRGDIAGTEAAVYRVPSYCDGNGNVTSGSTCPTRTCRGESFPFPAVYYRCDGSCPDSSVSAGWNPAACSNNVYGYLLAP